jgi:alpha-L-fucosidase 2
MPLSRSHRHAAHLVGLFPLHDNSISRDVAQRSYRHWAGMRDDWTIDSHVAAASLAARVREPNAATGHLRQVLDLNAWSVPFGVSQAVLDLVVHGRSGVVDVFPSIPDGWDEVSVESLRVPGAFLVDASRSRGRTDWIRVRGEKGRSLMVQHDIEDLAVTDPNGRPLPSRSTEAGAQVTLPPSGAVVLSRRSHVPDLLPRNVVSVGASDALGSKA